MHLQLKSAQLKLNLFMIHKETSSGQEITQLVKSLVIPWLQSRLEEQQPAMKKKNKQINF
ncbi:MAG: hypothetical protein Q8869_03020 [Candidatus Phytoplasma australasiaticum]|nr:hypothetical protein [Candidatus Phytoplasma australasiaticum]